MSTYTNGEWTHAEPTCPTCCEVRARQGFVTPQVLGEDCEGCKMTKEAAIYYASDAYKAEVEKAALTGNTIMALGGVILPGEAGLPEGGNTEAQLTVEVDEGMEQ